MPDLPDPGAATLGPDADPASAALAFRRLGQQWLRLDLADRLATHAHQARDTAGADPIDHPLVTSLGLSPDTVRRLMAEVGFVPKGEGWAWRGNRPHHHPKRRAPDKPVTGHHAFAALAALRPR